MSIQLRVGGVYRNHMGELVTIIKTAGDPTYPFISSTHYCYTSNGRFLLNEQRMEDLIEEVVVTGIVPNVNGVLTNGANTAMTVPETNTNNISVNAPTFDLRMRLAIRLAAVAVDQARAALSVRYNDDDLQLIFDALADGLGKRTEDELLTLVGK